MGELQRPDVGVMRRDDAGGDGAGAAGRADWARGIGVRKKVKGASMLPEHQITKVQRRLA